MIHDLFFLLLFFLPAGVANMAPVFVAKHPAFESYSYPLDFYKTFCGKRIFGDHKTIRGIVGGSILGTFSAFLLYAISPTFYAALPANPFILGFLLSFGGLAGDAIKSFFKRQFGTPPGKAWIPFDQVDYIIGAIIFSFFYVRLSFYFYMLAIVLFFLLHVSVSYMGYKLQLKDDPI